MESRQRARLGYITDRNGDRRALGHVVLTLLAIVGRETDKYGHTTERTGLHDDSTVTARPSLRR